MRREVKVGNMIFDAEARQNILQVMANNWVSPGPFVEQFEKEFARVHGWRHGVMVNSGTDALRIALAALKEKEGWKDGKEVIVPALTFVATVNVILQNRLTPVFVDVDAKDLTIDIEKSEKAVSFDTVAMVPVHLFGHHAAMAPIKSLAHSLGLRVIEDSCETMGIPAGEVGDIACFSTYACHLIQTGVGGICATDNEDLYPLMRSFMNHGRRSEKRTDRFIFDRIGYSSRPDEFQAAIGLAQLKTLQDHITLRRRNANVLSDALREVQEDLWTLEAPQSAWMMFPIILNDKSIDRDKFCAYLENCGVETRPLFPLLTQPCYETLSQDRYFYETFPVALNASRHGFYVGCHPGLTEEDMAWVARVLKEAIYNFSTKRNPVVELAG